jgi:flagellar hook-associated protein 1 FlgK
MSSLFDSLRYASRSLDAHRLGIDVAGQNIANVNTAGYTRRMLLLGEVPATDFYNAGRGVEAVGIIAHRDPFIEARIRREQSGASFDQAIVGSLSALEANVAAPGQGIDHRLTALFDAFNTFADDVRSVAAREGVVQQGQALAQAFRSMASALQTSQRDADLAIRSQVNDINALATEIAALNVRIGDAAGDVQAMIDQRNVALTELAKLANVSVVEHTNGTADVSIGSGRPLVMGRTAYQVEAADGPAPLGLAVLTLGDYDLSSEITSGSLGGLMHVRDVALPAHAARLDQLAWDVATAINGVHSAGYDANGNPAGMFFVPPAGVAGAAAAMAVDPALDGDSALLAGSATGAVGDNGIARALAALRDQPVVNGGSATPAQGWGMFVYHLGADVNGALDSVEGRDEIVRQLQRLRDEASGVSLDEEAANLMKFQRAYEANARFFTTIVETIDTLMEMVG